MGGRGGGSPGNRGGSSPAASVPAAAPSLTDQIKEAYQNAGGSDGSIVTLAEVRSRLGGTREEQDSTLIGLVRERKIRLFPEENQKAIGEAGRAAAINISGEMKHLIVVNY